MAQNTPRPARGQVARDLRLFPTPDGLEVERVFHRPGSRAFQDFGDVLAAVPEILELDEQHDLLQKDLRFATKIAAERARFTRERGRK